MYDLLVLSEQSIGFIPTLCIVMLTFFTAMFSTWAVFISLYKPAPITSAQVHAQQQAESKAEIIRLKGLLHALNTRNHTTN